mmetsp:Transcript_20584/g.71200  ORF Transcript_20584/g.71200 Transcript_20584/m.71200 type:complete len:153 (+) Transcript_20584:84-542(+)
MNFVRILGMNPSPYALQGTNCYLVGTGRHRVLLDTGEGRPEFHRLLDHVLAEVGCELCGIVLTHSHADHMGGVPQILRDRPGIYVRRFVPGGGWKVGCMGTPEDDRHPSKIWNGAFEPLQDEAVLRVEGATLRMLHTPGHATDHAGRFMVGG